MILFSFILASIFCLSISMHLLLTSLYTFLLFSSPIIQISPMPSPSNSCFILFYLTNLWCTHFFGAVTLIYFQSFVSKRRKVDRVSASRIQSHSGFFPSWCMSRSQEVLFRDDVQNYIKFCQPFEYFNIQSVPQRKRESALQRSVGRCCLKKWSLHAENHTKHINTFCGQNAELMMLK
jgi:hypothetical protein